MTDALRSRCRGVAPLDARLEPWQLDLCGQPGALAALLAEHGSPLNLIDPAPMGRNAAELLDAARAAGVPARVFFARKANKAIALVDEARRLGLGVDVASELELRQVLDRGVAAEDVIVTAAVKPRPLLELCVRTGVTVAIDNRDELDALAAVAAPAERTVPVALRLAPVIDGRPPTRFGLSAQDALTALGPAPAGLAVTGIHFHLDGYAAAERVAALGQALALHDALVERGHRPAFIDIGGGIPMSYLDDGGQWTRFWQAHRTGLLGDDPLTFAGHGLGHEVRDGATHGRWQGYPYHQALVRGPWLAEVLAGTTSAGETVAEALTRRALELRCEPGRSLLDGCGMTAARVEFRKQRTDGVWLVGLAMNRTQCRTTSEDFLVDPLLIPGDGGRAPPVEAYLVGAYCIERELLTWRRLRFPEGVGIGDVVVFPNTAGYLMHILESASHQIPLARNLVVDGSGGMRLDDIDRA